MPLAETTRQDGIEVTTDTPPRSLSVILGCEERVFIVQLWADVLTSA